MFYRNLFNSNLISALSVLVIMGFTAISTLAQPIQQPGNSQPELKEDFKKKELNKFIDANKAVTTVQKKNEQKIIKTIESEGLDVQTFNKILTAKQRQQQAKDASEEELKKFNIVINDVIQIQQKMRQKMSKAITNSGMEADKYEQIMYAYQNSDKVKQEINQLIQQDQKN